MRANHGILRVFNCGLVFAVVMVALKIKKMFKNILFFCFLVAAFVILNLLFNYAINRCLQIFGTPLC
jgi:hypothetical protein